MIIMISYIGNVAHTSRYIEALSAATPTAAGAMMSATSIAIIAATTIIAHEVNQVKSPSKKMCIFTFSHSLASEHCKTFML